MPIRCAIWNSNFAFALVLFCLVGCGAPAPAPKEAEPPDSPASKSIPAESGNESNTSSRGPAEESKEPPKTSRSENDGPILEPQESK